MSTLGTDTAATAAASLGPKPSHETRPEEGYDRFEEYVRLRVGAGCRPLLTIMPDDNQDRLANELALWQRYLDAIPADRRQHYTCSACEAFIRRYGGLVVVHQDGTTSSVLWSRIAEEYGMIPAFFEPSVRAMREFVEANPVRGVFLDDGAVWGTPVTGPWTHLSGTQSETCRHVPTAAETTSQAVAVRREGFVMVSRALADFTESVAATALEILKQEVVPNGEKALGVAQWFAKLHAAVRYVRGPRRDNLVWQAVADSPPAFHHVRSTMIGTLLADIAAAKPAEAIKRAWVEKMDPGRYLRPQVAPTAEQVEAANRLAEKLGITPASLARRYARLDELPAQARLWSPPDSTPPHVRAGGTFSGVAVKESARRETLPSLPQVTMTWEKFSRTVLGEALEVRFLTPTGAGSFYGLLTAADPAGPPLHQWDGLAGLPRNPVSWYVQRDGSYASRWTLRAGDWVQVKAVVTPPYHWNDRPHLFTHHMPRAFVVLAGARDMVDVELCLFPETLRAELHPARAVIEQYSKQGRATGAGQGDANGYVLTKINAAATFWVRTATTTGTYRIDRWD